MSDYDFRPAGSLKLKGTVIDGGVKKKKKKSKSKTGAEEDRELKRAKELLLQDDADLSLKASGSGRNSPAASSSKNSKTEAEKRFDEVQKRRLQQRVAKLANKTHKDRVNEFNSHLETLSEHHDIPKVGPG